MFTCYALVVPLFTTLLLLTCKAEQKASGCRPAGLCCKKRDNGCFVNGPRMDDPDIRLTVDGSGANGRGTCYCDENCMTTKDCCKDYVGFCIPPVIDCEVSTWREWSGCSRKCGFGKKRRARSIVHRSRNGGRTCPSLAQKKVCFAKDCKKLNSFYNVQTKLEVARIMPLYYGDFRFNKQYHPGKDIRKNLYKHYKHFKLNYIDREPYCAFFEITSSRGNCQQRKGEGWAASLKTGAEICVECQQPAMKSYLGQRCMGDGLLNQESRWNAVNSPGCHGYWVRRSSKQKCTCNTGPGSDFILI